MANIAYVVNLFAISGATGSDISWGVRDIADGIAVALFILGAQRNRTGFLAEKEFQKYAKI